MNRIIALLLTISFLTISCNESSDSKFEYKEWHKSPTRSPLSSTVYPFVEWEKAMEIKIGLTEKNADFDFQYYHHPVNAIVFTKSPQNENYEIALKLSEDKNEVTDISFLKLESINE
ncbi:MULTISPECIES: hypothetical protein [Mesonia]|uniref:Uncharacterized protein n=1 Tax=Mesonia oceanica TaxID=2687242 RepID=A0AC61Y5W5_9FLAO|nr:MULTISPECIES: hypothetical protein [Mesonia]MAN28322.1 hypothetical protein [Mesonia sp.]MAQ39730.1 hypothetical protein [Mesonia sp.]VVU99851.1 hypothetical protein FVB9532_01112 [Mesonia oceanica]|tara:strand:- start:282 stop:632 length:351 start_codon:yes stop_codon:yes gene_type:complete